MNDNRLDDYIQAHPRESLRIVTIGIFVLWQSVVAFLGIICYLLLSRCFRLSWWITLTAGVLTALSAVLFQQYYLHINFIEFVHAGFIINIAAWKHLFASGFSSAISYYCYSAFNYLVGFPLLMAGMLEAINLIPSSPHQSIMQALHNGNDSQETLEANSKKIDKALEKLREEDHDGTVLGVSKYSGMYSIIPDRDINQVMLVLGTTGSGKTITLRRFYKRAIVRGYPLVIIDGKPDADNVNWLVKLAEQYGRRFIGFNCDNCLPYDPLANGGFTELKDKVISLKDEWSSDYYRSIAEDYLQTTFEVLLKSKKSFDLREVVDCLNHDDLADLALKTEDLK